MSVATSTASKSRAVVVSNIEVCRAVRWLAQVTDKEAGRYSLGCIYVDEDAAVATDGRRLHYVKHPFFSGVIDGLYDPIQAKVSGAILTEAEGKFPHWREIIPGGTYCVLDQDYGLEPPLLMSLVIGHAAKRGALVSAKYIQEALSLPHINVELHLSQFDTDSRPILIKLSGNEWEAGAVIMPIDRYRGNPHGEPII